MAASVSSPSCRRARSSWISCESLRTSALSESSYLFLASVINRDRNAQFLQNPLFVPRNADEGSPRRRVYLHQARYRNNVVLPCQLGLLIEIDHLNLEATLRQRCAEFGDDLNRSPRLGTRAGHVKP